MTYDIFWSQTNSVRNKHNRGSLTSLTTIMIGNSIGQQQLMAKCKTTYSQNTVVQTQNILYTESVKDSGNSTFFQKNQLILVEKSRKIRFLYSLFIEQNAKLLTFLFICWSIIWKVKNGTFFFFKKRRYFSFRVKIFGRQYCFLLIHFSPNKQSFRTQKRYRISSNNSRPSINRLPRIIAPFRRKYLK